MKGEVKGGKVRRGEGKNHERRRGREKIRNWEGEGGGKGEDRRNEREKKRRKGE